MATLQVLKKKLKGIKSTEKLTKAMKTVSAARFSQLNRISGAYSAYGTTCTELYSEYEKEILEFFPDSSTEAPEAVFIMASNRGMCGGFNSELLSFAKKQLDIFPEGTLFFPCGKKAINFFTEKKIPFSKSFVFSEVPTSDEAKSFLDEILCMRENGIISKVTIIYPSYVNVMKQIPVVKELFTVAPSDTAEKEDRTDILFIPDRKTVMKSIAETVIRTAVFQILLETALGAQAATLTTMRSAYDTATSYCAMLETEINRKRQSEVTADVLETAVERN